LYPKLNTFRLYTRRLVFLKKNNTKYSHSI